MRFMLIASIVALFVGALAGCTKKVETASQTVYSPEEFLSREVSVGGNKSIRYRVFSPRNRDPELKVPVMLYLHGADDRGEDNERQLNDLAGSIGANGKNIQFVIVFPQCPKDRFWDKEIIRDAMTALEQTAKDFNGDDQRFYLAGFSLGGYGVWTTAAMHPGKFAAIIPMSGRVLPRAAERKYVDLEMLKLADAGNPYAAFAEKIGNAAIWIFHGANDNIVPVENSRRMFSAFTKNGNANVRYSELPNVGHSSIASAFSDPELYTWLANQRL